MTAPASGFLRPIALLMSGTALAQAVPVLLSPVLTRVYSPEQFGAFAWSVSLVTVAVLLASGAYDQAVALPPARGEALALVLGLLALGAAAAVLLALASLAELLLFQTRAHRLWFVPAATLLTSAFNALSALATREARFALLVRARVALALGGVTVTLALGLAGFTDTGLFLGNLAGLLLSTTWLAAATWRDERPPLTAPRRASVGSAIASALRAHRRCPQFLLPSSLLNTITNQLPVWFLGRIFGAATLGQYSLMNRVLSVPLALVSSSVGDVFKQRVAAEVRDTGQCRATFAAFARTLFLLVLPPTLALLFFGPDLFAFVFGPEWRDAGRYAQLLAILFAFRFAVSPLTYVVIAARRARLDLILQLLCLFAALAAWAVAARGGSVEHALITFGGLYSVVYLLYLGFSFRLAQRA